jgi:hypothetical protein
VKQVLAGFVPSLALSSLPEHIKAHQWERQAVPVPKEERMPTHHTHHTSPSRPLERTLIAFCLLAALSGVVVYLAAPSVYTNLLMLHLSPTDRYPFAATLVLVGILLVIAIVMVGVLQHWRWLSGSYHRLWSLHPGHSGNDPPVDGRCSELVPCLVQSLSDGRCSF